MNRTFSIIKPDATQRNITGSINKIIEDNEYLIHAKTESNNFEEIKNLIEELHNYETPEIISLEIYQGNEKYLKWLRDETG